MEGTTGGAVYLNRMAAQGDGKVQFRIGKLFLNGIGVAKDKTTAMKWINESAAQGYAAALCELGRLYSHGETYYSYHKPVGVPQPQKDSDNQAARHWFELAAKQRHPEAYDGLFELEFEKLIAYDEADWKTCHCGKRMYKWASKGRETANKTSWVNIGICYELGIGITKNIVKAMEWYEKAAGAGSKFGAFYLACIYASGEYVMKDYDRAWQWHQYARELGLKSEDEQKNGLLTNRLLYYERKSDPAGFGKLAFLYPYHFRDAKKIETELTALFAPYIGRAQSEEKNSCKASSSKEKAYLPSSVKCIYDDILTIQQCQTELAQQNQMPPPLFNDLIKDDLIQFYKSWIILYIQVKIVRTWFYIKKMLPEEYKNLPFRDDNAILDDDALMVHARSVNNSLLKMMILNIVEIRIELEAVTNSILNIYNDLIHLQENPDDVRVIKKMADLFMKGSPTVPRSYLIAREWYSKIPDDEEARTNLAKIDKLLK